MKELKIQLNHNLYVGSESKIISVQAEAGDSFDLTDVKHWPWFKDAGWYTISIIDHDKDIVRSTSQSVDNIDHMVNIINQLNETVDNY